MCTPPAQFGLSTRHPPRWPVHQPPLQSSRLPYHLVVNDPGLELEEKVFVFRIIFRGLDALARKGANTRHALPERQSREVGDLAVPALKDVDADVPRNRAIVGDGALLQKLSVVLSLSARNASVPHTTIIGSSSPAGPENRLRRRSVPRCSAKSSTDTRRYHIGLILQEE